MLLLARLPFSRYTLISSLCLSAVAAAPPYLTVLSPTSDLPQSYIYAGSINNKGVVAGYELDMSGATIPLIWVDGVPQKLSPFPGIKITNVGQINNAGTVIGNGLDVAGSPVILVWEVGTTLLYYPPAPEEGATLLNNANHALISTFTGDFWIFDINTTFTTHVPAPLGFCPSPSFNDGDQFLSLSSTNCQTDQTFSYAVISPLGAVTPFVPAAAPAYFIDVINNRDQAAGFASTGVTEFWNSPATVQPISNFLSSGRLNNAGVLAGTDSGLAVHHNGKITRYTLPAPLTNPQVTAINDAGQIVFQDTYSPQGHETIATIVLTPQGKACATDVTRQLTITAGPITADPANLKYMQTVRVINPTATTIAGPISLGFEELPDLVSLAAPAGATLCTDAPQGTAFITSSASLIPMGEVDFNVSFDDVEGVTIAYTPVILAGAGSR